MQKVCDITLRLFGDAAAAVMVYDRQGEQLVVRAGSTFGATAGSPSSASNTVGQANRGTGDAGAMPPSLSADHAFSELVIQQNRTACLNDVSLRPDLSLLEIPGLGPFQAVLGAPLQQDGAAFGAVAIYSLKPREWTAEQFRLAQWLADQCAHILETLHMQQEVARVASFPTVNPNPIVEADCDGRVTYVNPAAQRLFPISRARQRSPLARRLGGPRRGLPSRRLPAPPRSRRQRPRLSPSPPLHAAAGAHPQLRPGRHRAEAGGGGAARGGAVRRARQGRRRARQPRQGPLPGGPQPRAPHAA